MRKSRWFACAGMALAVSITSRATFAQANRGMAPGAPFGYPGAATAPLTNNAASVFGRGSQTAPPMMSPARSAGPTSSAFDLFARPAAQPATMTRSTATPAGFQALPQAEPLPPMNRALQSGTQQLIPTDTSATTRTALFTPDDRQDTRIVPTAGESPRGIPGYTDTLPAALPAGSAFEAINAGGRPDFGRASTASTSTGFDAGRFAPTSPVTPATRGRMAHPAGGMIETASYESAAPFPVDQSGGVWGTPTTDGFDAPAGRVTLDFSALDVVTPAEMRASSEQQYEAASTAHSMAQQPAPVTSLFDYEAPSSGLFDAPAESRSVEPAAMPAEPVMQPDAYPTGATFGSAADATANIDPALPLFRDSFDTARPNVISDWTDARPATPVAAPNATPEGTFPLSVGSWESQSGGREWRDAKPATPETSAPVAPVVPMPFESARFETVQSEPRPVERTAMAPQESSPVTRASLWQEDAAAPASNGIQPTSGTIVTREPARSEFSRRPININGSPSSSLRSTTSETTGALNPQPATSGTTTGGSFGAATSTPSRSDMFATGMSAAPATTHGAVSRHTMSGFGDWADGDSSILPNRYERSDRLGGSAASGATSSEGVAEWRTSANFNSPSGKTKAEATAQPFGDGSGGFRAIPPGSR